MNNWFTNRKTGFVSVFHHNKSSFKKFCVVAAGMDWWLVFLNHFHHLIQSSLNKRSYDYSNHRFFIRYIYCYPNMSKSANLDTINHMSFSICF